MAKFKQIAIPIGRIIEEYNRLRSEKKLIEDRMKELADNIKSYAQEHGVKDDKGSYYSEVDNYVFGKQAKTSIKFNEEKAMNFLNERGFNECIKTVQVLDEDAIEARINNGDISYDDLEGIVVKKTTYAVDVKEKAEATDVEEHSIQLAASKKPKK